MYAGLAILSSSWTIFLQQVAGYSALESGLTIVPLTLVMFASRSGSALLPTGSARVCSWGRVR